MLRNERRKKLKIFSKLKFQTCFFSLYQHSVYDIKTSQQFKRRFTLFVLWIIISCLNILFLCRFCPTEKTSLFGLSTRTFLAGTFFNILHSSLVQRAQIPNRKTFYYPPSLNILLRDLCHCDCKSMGGVIECRSLHCGFFGWLQKRGDDGDRVGFNTCKLRVLVRKHYLHFVLCSSTRFSNIFIILFFALLTFKKHVRRNNKGIFEKLFNYKSNVIDK